jgi:hypothetical protein
MLTVESESKRLLLISNSTVYGSGYLEHAEKEILDFLGASKRVLFIPFALYDRDAYVATARERSMLKVRGKSVILKGVAPARIFRRGHEPVEMETGSKLEHLIC